MDTNWVLTAVSLRDAALRAQVVTGTVLFLASLMLRQRRSVSQWARYLPTYEHLAWIILAVTLATTGILAFVNPSSQTHWAIAMLITFGADLACLWILIATTGGSFNSPFRPVLFLLPSIAIFLQEPASRVLTYLAGSLAIFTYTFKVPLPSMDARDRSRYRVANSLVSIACLVLAVYIGLAAPWKP